MMKKTHPFRCIEFATTLAFIFEQRANKGLQILNHVSQPKLKTL